MALEMMVTFMIQFMDNCNGAAPGAKSANTTRIAGLNTVLLAMSTIAAIGLQNLALISGNVDLGLHRIWPIPTDTTDRSLAQIIAL
jgi:hypothetical protein